MKRWVGSISGLVGAMLLSAGAASAQGLDFLHAQRVEGGRVCMVDHFHSGTSSGHRTRQAAERDAIAGWAGFTAFEYGINWGSWRIAGSKSVKCAQAGGGWGCDVEARPCRPQTGGPRRKR